MVDTSIYMLNEIRPVQPEDDLKTIMKRFKKTGFSVLPVVNAENKVCGTVFREDIEFLEDRSQKLESYRHLIRMLYVDVSMGWFEVFQFFANNKCDLIPIADREMHYLGYYELIDFLDILTNTPFLHEDGVILTISKGVKDYSFTEITQIVEANNATLFGAFVSKIDEDIASIVLKLSVHDINNTKLSFRRYGYQIVNEKEDDKYIDNLKERSDYLEKYLNI